MPGGWSDLRGRRGLSMPAQTQIWMFFFIALCTILLYNKKYPGAGARRIG